jgi:oligopeptide transport system substrate-binding protein
MAQTLWLAQYNDQVNILERYAIKSNLKNYANWENPQYAALVDRSAYETNPEQRFKTLEEAETIFADEMPVTPIFHMTFAFSFKPYLHNIELSPVGDVYFERISIDLNEKHKR